MQEVVFQDLGLIDYKSAWDLQERLHASLVAQKLAGRRPEPALPSPGAEATRLPPPAFRPGTGPSAPLGDRGSEPAGSLLFCEHPHVFTLGRSGDEKHLLAGEEELKALDASYYRNNRGGDITYHGPGQLVGYPILDLDRFFTDIHRYLRTLEEAVIRTLSAYGIAGGRIEGLTGVWLDPGVPEKARKICAFGVRCSRWVTMHGFAFNVNTDLSYFSHIVPCGIPDKAVTSMQHELGAPVAMEEVKEKLKDHLQALFGMTLVPSP